MQISKILIGAFALSVISSFAYADDTAFHNGTVITDFGKIATIDSDMSLPKKLKLKVSFDVAAAGQPGTANRKFDSLARFINMHADAGVALKNMDIALVVHGGASKDLTRKDYYAAQYAGAENKNAELIKALVENGVEIYLCGQSAVYHDIDKSDLLPGVKMALSAMTAHALLQQDDYTLNPF
ncbi:DsrE family protein [Litorimonas sp. WD9-15]|uniref:DsrE family protein n=1 Tax=Litorimonas sp. WD9-15 TaxID=3418716 RepID=UPI003D081D6F